jgi:Glycosyl transferase family 2
VQGFDPARGAAAGALDLCLRLGAAGGKLVVACASTAVHHARCGSDIPDADAAWLTRRWLGKIALFDPAGLRERPAPARRSGRPAVSVVVPVRNALSTVAPSLEGLARNLGPDDELIIADAGSDDGTGEFAALFAGERRGDARLLEARGLEEALRAGLGAATRPVTLLFHPVAEPPDGFLDALSALVERAGAPSTVATPAPPAGCCVLGPTAQLRAVGAASPGAFLATDPEGLSRALEAQGGRLGLVQQ